MNDNWYGSDSWYAPLNKPVPEKAAEKPKKKRRTAWIIAGSIFVLIAAIVGSSLAFAVKNQQPAVTMPQEEMPENWQDFFENFYEGVTTEKADIDIPTYKYDNKFELELKKPEGEELTLQELYQECSKSIVAISGYKNNTIGYSWGTGIILSPDGLILTNTHVIDKCDRATVTLYDDSEYDALLVGADSISDVALLKIYASDLPAAQFGESAEMNVGDKVAAIGNPLGSTFRLTLTDGIISAIERGLQYNGHSMNLLQTNTALNEGNSGGALFNMYGQVVGITNMKMMSSYSSIEGIGFAIPSSTVKNVVDSVIVNGEYKGRASIGITVGEIPSTAAEHYNLPEGLYVSAVSKGSDAEAQGIQVGDIVTAVNSIAVKTTQEVLDIKNKLKVGDTISITVWRAGETLTIDVKLVDTTDIY